MTAPVCERCDDPACDVPAANASVAALEPPPITPGENGCNCYGEFSRSYNPSRGCAIHGGPRPPALDAAYARLGSASRACHQRPAVDWRTRAKAAERQIHRLQHGKAIEGDEVCAAELWQANVGPLIEAVRAEMVEGGDMIEAVDRLLAATAKEVDRG